MLHFKHILLDNSSIYFALDGREIQFSQRIRRLKYNYRAEWRHSVLSDEGLREIPVPKLGVGSKCY